MSNAGSTAELMRKFGFGHTRSYGVGGVTTPSFRGSGGSHTQILWNGLTLVSPLNGQSDLSLLPMFFTDAVNIQTGGSATLFGSGAIGGTLRFTNKASFRQGWKGSITENIGSFMTQFHGTSVSWSNDRWSTSTRVFYTSSKNDFTFTNRNTAPPTIDTRDHNAFRQLGVLHQDYWQLNAKQLVSLRIWAQDNHHEIPSPVTVPTPAQETQQDRFIRSMLGWDWDYGGGHLFIQSAQVHHEYDYRNPLINLTSKSSFDTFVQTAENSFTLLKKIENTSGLQHQTEVAHGGDYSGTRRIRNRTALYTTFQRQTSRWQAVFAAREELINGRLTPWSPSLSGTYQLNSRISIFGNTSRNYRIPTFNDLFWIGAGASGNPNLKPELSWSEEVGLRSRLNSVRTNLLFEGQIAFFSNQVNNWIQWTPQGPSWSPNNIKKVWARGMETNFHAARKFGAWHTQLTLRYSFTASTSADVYDANRQNEVGKQLFFTPRHEGSLSFRITKLRNTWSLISSYTGLQYTDEANTSYLAMKAYQVTNFWWQHTWRSTSFQLEVNNIFNQEILARPGYPLPGRNVKAGINLHFNQKKTP